MTVNFIEINVFTLHISDCRIVSASIVSALSREKSHWCSDTIPAPFAPFLYRLVIRDRPIWLFEADTDISVYISHSWTLADTNIRYFQNF